MNNDWTKEADQEALMSLEKEMKAIRAVPTQSTESPDFKTEWAWMMKNEEIARLKNTISSLHGDLKKKEQKLEGVLKLMPQTITQGVIKKTKKEIRFGVKAILNNPLSLAGTISEKWKELLHFYNCILTINCSGNPETQAPSHTRRQSVWNKHKLVFVTGHEAIQCIHCAKLMDFDEMTVEHMKPSALGGGDEMDNLRPACYPCNSTRPLKDISDPPYVPVSESFLILE